MDIKIFIMTVNNSAREKILKNYYNVNNFNNIEIISFPPGNELNLIKLEKEGYIDYNAFMSYKIYDYMNNKFFYGTLGCAYGHVAIYKKMLDENIKECIIMEDNVLLKPNYLNELNNLFTKLQVNNIEYDIIHLHSFNENKYRELIINDIYKGSDECHGTKMYYLNNKTANALFINNFPIITPSDGITCIPSRNLYKGLKSIYFKFINIEFISSPSIRCNTDGIHDNNKINNIIEKKELNFLKLELSNKKQIIYKLNKNSFSEKVINKINEFIQYKIIPLHYKYNIYAPDQELKLQLLLDNKLKEFNLTYKNYEELECIINNKIDIKINKRDDLLDIIRRLKNNFDKEQSITTMIKCSNYSIKGIDITLEDEEYFNMNYKFGKLYLYNYAYLNNTGKINNLGNIFLYCSFSNNLNKYDKKLSGYSYLGDIVLDDNTINLTNDEIIKYYSDATIENIIVY